MFVGFPNILEHTGEMLGAYSLVRVRMSREAGYTVISSASEVLLHFYGSDVHSGHTVQCV